MRNGIALVFGVLVIAACTPSTRPLPPAEAAAPAVLCNGASVSCMNEVLALGIK